MSVEERVAARRDRFPHRAPIWFAWLGGAVAWATHITLSYAILPYVCAGGPELTLHVLTAGTAIIAGGAVGMGWRALHRLGHDDPQTPPHGGDRRNLRADRFLAASGALLSAFFLSLILVEGLQVLLLADPCMAIPTEDAPIIMRESERGSIAGGLPWLPYGPQ